MRQPGCRRRTCGRSTRSIWQPPSASATAWASSSAMTGDWRMPPSRPVSRWRCPEPEIASSSMIPNAAMNAALAAVASRHRRRHRGARSARCAPRPCVRRGHSVDRRRHGPAAVARQLRGDARQTGREPRHNARSDRGAHGAGNPSRRAYPCDRTRCGPVRGQNISLADGFAIATAQSHGASLASFDVRVRRALPAIGVELATEVS